MEKIAAMRAKQPKEFDPTQVHGHGLLEELSLAELREKTALMRIQEREQMEKNKAAITEARDHKSLMLLDMQRSIEFLREKVRSFLS